ncbi:hypothetical protein BJ742DRAFT_735062 [Cladochytrium replicatum]|nr:hypothetical protein BJ742DRAFT_735062 [Cladochytrium replicatum]
MSAEFCWSAQSSQECTSFFTTCVWCPSLTPGCFKQPCPSECSTQDVDEGNCYRFAPSTGECLLRRCNSVQTPGNVDCTDIGPQPGVKYIVCGPDCLNQFSAQSCQRLLDSTFSIGPSINTVGTVVASTVSAAISLSPTVISLSASGAVSTISSIPTTKPTSSNGINPVAPSTSSVSEAPDLNASNLTRNILLVVVGAALIAVLISIIVLGERRRRRQAAARKAARGGEGHLPITREINNTRSPPVTQGANVASDQSYLNFRTPTATSWNRFVGRFARPGATPSPTPTVNTSSPLTSENQPLIRSSSITADPPVRPTVITTAERRQIQAEHQRVRDSMRDVPPNPYPEHEQAHSAEEGSPRRRPTNRTLDPLRRKMTMNSESASDSIGSTPETPGGSIDLRGRLPSVSARSENYSDTP